MYPPSALYSQDSAKFTPKLGAPSEPFTESSKVSCTDAVTIVEQAPQSLGKPLAAFTLGTATPRTPV